MKVVSLQSYCRETISGTSFPSWKRTHFFKRFFIGSQIIGFYPSNTKTYYSNKVRAKVVRRKTFILTKIIINTLFLLTWFCLRMVSKEEIISTLPTRKANHFYIICSVNVKWSLWVRRKGNYFCADSIKGEIISVLTQCKDKCFQRCLRLSSPHTEHTNLPSQWKNALSCMGSAQDWFLLRINQGENDFGVHRVNGEF